MAILLGSAGLLALPLAPVAALHRPVLVATPTLTPLGPRLPLAASACSLPLLGPDCSKAAGAVGPLATVDLWTNVSAGQRFSPPALRGASLAFDPLDNYVILFGGCTAQACPGTPQTWTFAGGSWTNITASSPQPPGRTGASLGYDSRDGYVVLFGGWGAGGRPLNDTWAFAAGSWTNITAPSTSPPAVGGAAFTYDHADGYLVLFGGGPSPASPLSQTWRFVAGGWRNLTGSAGVPPPPRIGGGFAWDDTDGYGLLFGGRTASAAVLNDTWTFLHGHWSVATLTSPTAPPPRSGAVLSYYGTDNAVDLFGGNGTSGPLNDTWRYAAGRWTNLTGLVGTPPSARDLAAGLSSSVAWTSTGVRQRLGFLLLVGGGTAGCSVCPATALNDTWVFEPALQTVASALPTVVEVGQPAVFSALVTGGSPTYLLAWQFGDGTSVVATAPSHAFGRAATFTVLESVTDQAGVRANSTVNVSVVPGPSVSVTLTLTTTDVDRPVGFSATTSLGTPPYTVRWAFGDGASASGAGPFQHSYALPGLYTGNATATDAAGGVGVTIFTVRVNPAMAVVASVPSAPLPAGTNGSFTASVNAGTAPYVANWSFGDGASATGLRVLHAYPTGGTFTVHLTVTDGVGASVQMNFSLTAENATAVPLPPPPTFLGVTWPGWVVVGAVVALGAVGVVLFLRQRRRSRRAPGPIAAAAVGEGQWGSAIEGERRADSRSARRTAQRWGRR